MLPRSSCLTFKTFLVRTKAREWLKFRWRRVWGEHKLKEIEKSKKIGKKCKTYINDMELKFANVKSKLDYEWKSAENWQVLGFFALFLGWAEHKINFDVFFSEPLFYAAWFTLIVGRNSLRCCANFPDKLCIDDKISAQRIWERCPEAILVLNF